MTEEQRKEYKSLYGEVSEVLSMLQTTMHRVVFNDKYFDRLTHEELARCHLNLNNTLGRMRNFIVKAEGSSNNE